jgi:hypothetical protein
VSAETARSTRTDPTTGKPRLSHLVDREGEKDGPTRILEARVHGTPIQALCGHVLVPSHDPADWPLCEQCHAIFKHETGGYEDGYRDA